MGKKTTKQLVNRKDVVSVTKQGKFIFALKKNRLTDIYRKKGRSYKILIASDVADFYYRNGYLFFERGVFPWQIWSYIKEGDSYAYQLGEAVGHFFVLQQNSDTYKISFFDEKGVLRQRFCSNYFFDNKKGLLVIERESGAVPCQAWRSINISNEPSMTGFIPYAWVGLLHVYILCDAKRVEWGFIPCEPYYSGGVKKLRKADNHLRELCERNIPYRRTLPELWRILKSKILR